MSTSPDLARAPGGLPDPLPVHPCEAPFDLVVVAPGSKSITNRAYVLAALSRGRSRIVRPLRADDTDRLLAALETLGAGVVREGDDVLIDGVDGSFPRGGRVDLGDGGTPARFMLVAAALARAPVVVDGSPRMRERPVAELLELLRAQGVGVRCPEVEGHLPVEITGGPHGLAGGTIAVGPTASSQFVSALMLAGPWTTPPLDLVLEPPVTSASYLALTAGVLRDWPGEHDRVDDADLLAAVAGRHAGEVSIQIPTGPLTGGTFVIEPDASTAVYALVAAALVPGARVRCPGVGRGTRQPDARVVTWLGAAGATVAWDDEGVTVAHAGPLRGVDVDASLAPDGALALAAAAAVADGTTTIRGLKTLRVKETDRLTALATELERIGCRARATDDRIVIQPAPDATAPAVIRTYRDHRMAMAFATLGLVRPGLSIEDPGCVAKSHPGFWEDLARLQGARLSGDAGRGHTRST